MKTRNVLAALTVVLSSLSFVSQAHAKAGGNGPSPNPPAPKYADLVPIADPTTHMWTYITTGPSGTYLRIAVQNNGQADAGPFKVSLTFYRSLGADPVTVTVPFSGLQKGYFGYQLVPLPYGWGAGPAMNKLKFVESVDSGDNIAESNEVNNFQLVYALPYSTTPQ
jgi:hypothetical protein